MFYLFNISFIILLFFPFFAGLFILHYIYWKDIKFQEKTALMYVMWSSVNKLPSFLNVTKRCFHLYIFEFF